MDRNDSKFIFIMMMMKVKICRLANYNDALAAANLGTDFFGFYFSGNEVPEFCKSICDR